MIHQRAEGVVMPARRRVVTIEKTAKGLKLQVLLSWLMVLAGVGFFFVAYRQGIDVRWPWAVFLSGTVWRVVAGVLIWWRHG